MGEHLVAVGYFIPRHIKRAIEAEAPTQSTDDKYVQVGDIFRQIAENHWREYVRDEVRKDYERVGGTD